MSSSVTEIINQGTILVSDGATGTNLQARGLPPGMPSEKWVEDKPDMIIGLHKDFINAGSDIILTSTFNATRTRLEQFGLGERVAQINHKAVELARKASEGRNVFVAGSIGPLGHLLKPYGELEESTAFDAYSEQAKALSEAGVDLIVIETQYDINEAGLAIKAAQNHNSIPLICSFSYDRGTRTMMGVNPTMMGNEISKLGVSLIGINCGRSLQDNLNALHELRKSTQLPLWFKPNAGLPVIDEEGHSTYTVTPEMMGEQIKSWLDAGAQIVGGCCGTTPDHLKQIANIVKSE
jgi:5-methyltetrahydrofolate--homocysteine methyltransferase